MCPSGMLLEDIIRRDKWVISVTSELGHFGSGYSGSRFWSESSILFIRSFQAYLVISEHAIPDLVVSDLHHGSGLFQQV